MHLVMPDLQVCETSKLGDRLDNDRLENQFSEERRGFPDIDNLPDGCVLGAVLCGLISLFVAQSAQVPESHRPCAVLEAVRTDVDNALQFSGEFLNFVYLDDGAGVEEPIVMEFVDLFVGKHFSGFWEAFSVVAGINLGCRRNPLPCP